jgi:AcrR family transcriptional regulator
VNSSQGAGTPRHDSQMPSAGESARKAELAARLVDYSAAHGLSGVSLRPLAAAVGSSPRVLLYFFGSKEGLISEVLSMSRANQMKLVEQWLDEDSQPDADSITRLWQWLTDPAHADVERLFFESYGRSLSDRTGPWADFGKDSVADWLPLVARMLDPEHEGGEPEDRAAATLVLAILRGLLLDLLATGETDRIHYAFGLLDQALSAIRESPSES